MKKSLLIVQLADSGELAAGSLMELFPYFDVHGPDKILLVGMPSEAVSGCFPGFDGDDGWPAEIVAHLSPEMLASLQNEYDVTRFTEDCCGY